MTLFLVKLRSFLNKEEISGSVFVTAGILVGAVFSYILQIVLGRMLDVKEYGEFNALLSLSAVVAVMNTAFTTSIVKLTAQLKSEGRKDLISVLFRYYLLSFFVLGILLFVLVYLLKGVAASYLNIDDGSSVVLFGVFMAASLLIVPPVSYLQGLTKFRSYAVFSICNSAIRLLIPVFLVYMGYAVSGVFGGMAVALILSFSFGLVLLRSDLRLCKVTVQASCFRRLLKTGAWSVLVTLVLTTLINIDVVLVKHFMDSGVVGVYSAVVTVCKVFLFGAGTVSVVMFPLMSRAENRSGSHRKTFNNLLLVQMLLIAGGILLYTLFPDVLVSIMFGPSFMKASEYLPIFSLFVGCYLLAQFFLLFFLAKGQVFPIFLGLPVSASQVLLIYLFHSSIKQVISINVIVSALLVLALFLYYLKYAGVCCGARVQTAENYS